MSHRHCRYKAEYVNPITKRREPFECDEPLFLDNDLCVFHLSPQVKVSQSDYDRIFFERINLKLQSGQTEPVIFIGYHFRIALIISPTENLYLPHVNYDQHIPNFPNMFYFKNCRFYDLLSLNNLHFKAIYFEDTHFSDLIIGASLLEDSEFKRCEFTGITNMPLTRLMRSRLLDCRFSNSVRLQGLIVFCLEMLNIVLKKM